ncbi:MAG: hypothetical protein Q8881_02505 [Sweet potato little leaf phytoplasma]|nr:hypothetical protein [Sweet potato little leaf phytoplasma]
MAESIPPNFCRISQSRTFPTKRQNFRRMSHSGTFPPNFVLSVISDKTARISAEFHTRGRFPRNGQISAQFRTRGRFRRNG